jgi:hypothetical protein
MVEGKLSTLRDIQAGVPQGSVLTLILYSLYIKDTPQTPGVYPEHSLPMIYAYIQQIAKRVMFSESCNPVSPNGVIV